MNQIEKIIDIATWNRKEHFEHFSAFDDPFFGVTVLIRRLKTKASPFLFYYYIVSSLPQAKSRNSATASRATR
jgi:hypothetical protein